MKILSIVGARPQFIKLAPFIRSVNDFNGKNKNRIAHITVHTGQHYDSGMSEIFFRELEIPAADYNLEIGSDLHGKQTGKMIIELEKNIIELQPDFVVIYGDTNSTLAGALAASKLNFKLVHIESGLRSFNKRMPEEINRIVADHVSDILYAPTKTAVNNLISEGLKDRTRLSGDIMFDAILFNKKIAKEKSNILNTFNLTTRNYAVLTLHRAENTDNISILENILITLNEIASNELKILFPVHPRTAKFIKTKLIHFKPNENLILIDPVGYLDMISLVDHALLVLTDSGGLQKEAFFLKVPCITLRNETEWVETVKAKANIICGSSREKILNAVGNFISGKKSFSNNSNDYFGNGHTAEFILNDLLKISSVK